MSLFEELKRRNVFRVGTAYVVAAWVIIEVSSLILDIYDYPESVMRLLVALLALGLPFVLFFSWALEVTPDGIKREADVERVEGQSRFTAKRLNLVTIALLVIAIGLLALGQLSVRERTGSSSAEEKAANDLDSEQITQRMLEINRLKDKGDFPAAFALASDLQSSVSGSVFDDAFWDEISMAAEIRTEPSGARIYRQTIDENADAWEDLGTTPQQNVRFALNEGYRLRLELDGYRPVDLLHSAVTGYPVVGLLPIDPVILDKVDDLPEEMVRIRGFTRDLVDYDPFFIDRFEVTNRAYQKFVDAGGYQNEALWKVRFVDEGEEIPFAEAVQRFVDRTGRAGPSGWSGGVYPSGQGEHPVGGISWYEAAAFAEFVGKQLPAFAHFEQAHEFFRIDSWLESSRSNLESDGPRPVGTNRAMSTTGVYDLIGNVREWCWNDSGDQQKCTTGAAWPDSSYHSGWIIPKSPWDRDATNGFRLIRPFDDVAKIERLRQREDPEFRRDFWSETPATDAEFAIYKRLYAYDPAPLNPEVIWEREHDDWLRQRVAFDLPYGERGGAFIFMPKSEGVPKGTVIVWSGSGLLSIQDEFDEYWTGAYDFLIRNGYVVVMPIFKGAYDRDDENFSITHSSLLDNSSGTVYRDIQIKWLQDLSRTIDYLETRDDIDAGRLGYAGHSWGGQTAPIVLALEERFDAAVLNVGGLWEYFEFLPEADPINFVTRVRTPVLMLNGEFDIVFPYETGQLPMYEFLGTDPEHKKHVVTADAHLVSKDVLIRESLDWFEKYLD
jgi:dienelactone hydrolase